MTDQFNSAIMGALIGGFFSVVASFLAAKHSQKSQNSIFEKQLEKENSDKRDKMEKCAYLVKTEIITWVELAVFRTNIVRQSTLKRPANLDFNDNFRIYIEPLVEKLTFEEAQNLIVFYGMTKQISIYLQQHSFVNFNNEIPIELTKACEALVLKLFSNEKLEEYKMMDPSLITRDLLMKELNNVYKPLFMKLNSLSKEDIYFI